MAEADAEDRLFAEELLDVLSRIRHRVGIAGTVREKDAVGIEREHILGGRRRGNDFDAASRLRETAQDVALDAEVVRDDEKAGPVEARLLRLSMFLRRFLFFSFPVARPDLPAAFAPIVGAGASHRLDEINADEPRRSLRLRDELRRLFALCRDDRFLSALVA